MSEELRDKIAREAGRATHRLGQAPGPSRRARSDRPEREEDEPRPDYKLGPEGQGGIEIMSIDLKIFCADSKWNDGARYDLTKPWTAGHHRYATDGRIIVRVPAEFGEKPDRAPPTAGMFGEFDWTKCKAQLPEWDGSTHHYHDSCDYPQCHGGKISGGDRSCNACGGKGWTPERMETTVEFEGFNFGGGLIQRLQTLAGVRGRIYQDPLFLGDQGAGVQLRFIFDGEGQGILMNTTGVITTEGVQS